MSPQNILCVVAHYNRPKCLHNVLLDLARESRPWVRVRVYDDTSPMALTEAAALCQENGFDLRRLYDGPHKRERDWQLWTHIFSELKGEPEDTLFCTLPDDARLCKNFFERCAELWGDRPKKDNGTVSPFSDSRINRPQWTDTEPVRASSLLWRTQWTDGLFLCGHGTLRILNYSIPPQPAERFLDPSISTGVWPHMTHTLHEAGQSMYHPHQSLVVHVKAPSMLNPGGERLLHPIQAIRYVDGQEEHDRLAIPD